MWMDIAIRASRESHAKKRQVGAIAVIDNRIISIGINGTYPGHSNDCEVVTHSPDGTQHLTTLPTVIHAEAALLGKLAGCNESARGATIYITYAPCLPCAMQLAVAKIKEIVYNEENHRTQGVEYLRSCGIPSYNINQLN